MKVMEVMEMTEVMIWKCKGILVVLRVVVN